MAGRLTQIYHINFQVANAEWLQTQGETDEARAVGAGTISACKALKSHVKQVREQPEKLGW